ncbi:CHAP domain-containing protein [bacterium]|nr:CHAP domain-containing protein [bacterium]
MVSINPNIRNMSRLDFLRLSPDEQEQIIRQGNLYDESIFASSSNQEEDYARYLAETERTQASEEPAEAGEEDFDEIYNDEEAKKLIDLNHDGIISDEEKAIFEKYVKGKKGKITANDLKKILEDIKNGRYNYNPEEAALSETNPFAALAGFFNNIFGGSDSGWGGNNGGGVDQNATHDVKFMSLGQLEQEQSLRAENYSKAQQALNDIYNGTDEAVAAANEEYDKAKSDYAEKVKLDNEQTQQKEQQRAEKLEQIESAESRKDEISASINDTEGQITQVSNSISACESNIAALQSAMDSYDGADSEDPEAAAAAEAAKAQIAEQISQEEAKKTELETQKGELETKLNDLNQNLSDQENLLGDLNKEYQDIEQELFNVCSPETKAALLSLDTKKAAVGEVKADRISAVKQTLAESKASLEEVNSAYNDRKAKSDAMQYRNSDPSKVVDYVRELMEQHLNPSDIYNMLRSCKDTYEVDYSNGLKGQFVLDENGEKIQRDHMSVDMDAYCGEFAYYAYVEGMGYDNMPEWLQTCYYRSAYGFDVAGRGHEVDVSQAKPGDVITYDWNGDGRSDHVAIFAGIDSQGNIISVEGNTERGPVAQCKRTKDQVHGCYSV